MFFVLNLFFFTYFAKFGSSMIGITSAISSGYKLSSEGALSEPTDEVVSPSVCTSLCCLSTFNKAFLICMVLIGTLFSFICSIF